ncbi:MAG: hypothetical protein KJ939_05690 [Nanoarchaeota archaeon]|nr:hypothetical protein [Nanoarchaeota archaeon]MBU4352541.1 hypothetical protein [Nanoarchaeota archaeon]
MKDKKIVARIIIEVLGSPKNHIEETMKLIIDKLKEEEGINLLKRTTYESEQQENGLWSTFSEVELEVIGIQRLLDVCFDYMPSTIEILDPAGLEIDSNNMAEILNDLMAKLHRYDMLLKNFNAENTILKEKLEKIRQENFALIKKVQG